MKKYKEKYFTMLDTLAAMFIIGILVSLSVGVYTYVQDEISRSKTKALVDKLEMAMKSFKHEEGYFKQNSSMGDEINGTGYYEFKVTSDLKEYLDYEGMKGRNVINDNDIVEDAWGNKILYKCPGKFNNLMFDIGSKGKDGKFGSSGNSGNVDDFGQGDDITNFVRR